MNYPYSHITLILVLVFLLSCSSKKMVETKDDSSEVAISQQKLIEKNIKDPSKKAELLQIVHEIDIEAANFFQGYKEKRSDISKLFKNQDISREIVESKLNEINDHYKAYLLFLSKKRSEMRSITSRDEWTKIMAGKKAYIPK